MKIPAHHGIVAFALAAAGVAAALTPPEPPELAKLRFVPVAPCRVDDTRTWPVETALPLAPPYTQDFQIRGRCGIPATAEAFSLNVTAVPKGRLGYITVWPAGEPRPFASLLNSWTGAPVAAATFVRAGIDGAISIYLTDQTHLVIDVNGYFERPPTGLAFYPLKPCRLLDSRIFGAPIAWFTGGQSRTLQILGRCGVPSTAQAYALNFTAVAGDRPLGHLTAYPTGQPRPEVSTLNAWRGGTVANAAIVPAGNGGGIDVYASDTTDAVIDITGYFAVDNGEGLSLRIRPPCRVVDTRPGQGTSGSLGPPTLAAGSTREMDFREAQRCYTPPPSITAKPEPLAWVVNATAVPKAQLGFLTLWPAGSPRPEASVLNSTLIATAVSNMAIVQAGPADKISAFVSDETDLVLDLTGWFAP